MNLEGLPNLKRLATINSVLLNTMSSTALTSLEHIRSGDIGNDPQGISNAIWGLRELKVLDLRFTVTNKQVSD